MAVRSPYDFLRSPYDSRTMLGVRTILINLRMPHDHPKGLRLSYYFIPQIIIKPCGDRTIIAEFPIGARTMMLPTTCVRATVLRFFKFVKVQTKS